MTELQGYVVDLRRRLHQIPELGLTLPRTCQLVTQELDSLGIPYRFLAHNGSLMADIPGGRPGKRVALRCDMDGLLIQEETGLPFCSTIPGQMHACGHDAHTAMLLGAARLLWEQRGELSGSVRLLFQAGEEPCIGAPQAIEAGCLEGVDAIFGMHIGNLLGSGYPSGTVIVPEGGCMASADHFTLTIRGFGCHGSSPEKGVDPILIASHIVLALQALISRETAAAQPAVLSIGRIQGGTQFNLIPARVELEGTLRTLSLEVRQRLVRRLEELSAATAAAFGGSCTCEVDWVTPPLLNSPDMSRLAAEAIAAALPDVPLVTHLPESCMGSEDFAHYLAHVPGAYLFLSTYDQSRGTHIPHHNARFDVDEEMLWRGSAAYAAIARQFLSNL